MFRQDSGPSARKMPTIDLRPRRPEDALDDYSLDVPTIAETLATARGMLSPRARNGLDALPAEQQASTARGVASGAYLADWDANLSAGQPWPDTIKGTP